MDSTDALYHELEIMNRRGKKEKREFIKNEKILHSGEWSFVDFVEEFNKIAGENPSLATISKALNTAQSTITVLAERLMAKELIAKETSPNNKRITLVSLTDKGKEYLAITRENKKQSAGVLAEILGEEDTLEYIRLIKKINAYYDK